MRRPDRLRRWLESARNPPDRKELEAQWSRVTSRDVFVELAGLVAENDLPTLETFWGELTSPRLQKLFSFFHAPSRDRPRPLALSESHRDCVEGTRILSSACGMVAGALAVGTLLEDRGTEAASWMAAACAAWQGETSAPDRTLSPLKRPPDGASIASRLLEWCTAHGLDEAAAARWWACALHDEAAALRGSAPPAPWDAAGRERSLRLLAYRSDGAGAVGSLHVLRIPDGAGVLHPHPVHLGLAPVTHEFHETVERAWALATRPLDAEQTVEAQRHDYAWWVSGDLHASGSTLSGASHGAAMATLLSLAAADRSVDPDFAVTGTVDEEGVIGTVAGVREKTLAALRERDAAGHPAITCIYVPYVDHPLAAQAARELGRDPARSVRPATRVSDILEEASGLPEQISMLCAAEQREILDRAADRLRRPLRDWEEFTSLRAPVRVEPRAEGEEQDYLRSAPWSEVYRGRDRCVVLGEPGSGKTSLLWQEVGALCAEVLEHGIHTLPLGFYVTGREAGRLGEAESPEAWLRRLAERLADRRQVKPSVREAVVEELVRRLAEGRALLAIDALDEVSEDSRAVLAASLRAVRAATSIRFLVSLRLAIYEQVAGLVDPSDEMTLRPFSPEQARAAIERWFEDAPERAAVLWESLQRNGLSLLETPQLVWMICWLAREQGMRDANGARWQRRVDVFEAYYEELLRGWAALPPVPDDFQRKLFLPFAADVALTLLETGGAGDAFSSDLLKEAISETLPRYRHLRGRWLLDDLIHSGILTAARTPTGERAYAFPGAVFAEYLAARSLARTAGTGGWAAIARRVEDYAGAPRWNEVVVFLAALLDDPVPLFEALTEARSDDDSRTRLALAAMCLPDVLRGQEAVR
jgi:hypothetical protein